MQFKLVAVVFAAVLGVAVAGPAFDTSCLPFADNCVGGCCNANSKPEDIVPSRGPAVDVVSHRDCWPFADNCGAGCC
jgi:hypothetical protein